MPVPVAGPQRGVAVRSESGWMMGRAAAHTAVSAPAIAEAQAGS